MAEWKKYIFIKAIEARVSNQEGTVEEILITYTKLTDSERKELASCFA